MSEGNKSSKEYLGLDRDELRAVVRERDAEIERLRAALSALLTRYVDLVNCGDCGNWDPEKEREVIAARGALSGDSPTETRKPCSICGSTEHSHLHCYGPVHETSVLVPKELAERLAWEHRDGSKLTVAINELRALLRSAQETKPDPAKCPDCGVQLVPGARHFSGCKSHPGEPALKATSVKRCSANTGEIGCVLVDGHPGPHQFRQQFQSKASAQPIGHRIDCGVLNNPLSCPCTCGYNAENGRTDE